MFALSSQRPSVGFTHKYHLRPYTQWGTQDAHAHTHKKKKSSHGELRRIAVKWSGLLQDKPAFNHWRQSSPEEYRQTYQVIERNKVKYMGPHKQGLRCSRDTLPLPLSPINYQRWLITWLITALNCLCSRGSTAIFAGKITNSMKSVTITMIDGVCFIGVCSSAPGTGRVLGEGHQREIAAVFTSRDSQFPRSTHGL